MQGAGHCWICNDFDRNSAPKSGKQMGNAVVVVVVFTLSVINAQSLVEVGVSSALFGG